MKENDIDYTPVINILKNIFGKYRMHNKDKYQISFDCPVCSYEIKELDHGDGKGNLEINYQQQVYKCWACSDTHDTHGSLRYLIRKYGTAKQIKDYDLYYPNDVPEIIVHKKNNVKLPKEFISFISATNGLKLTHFYKQAKNYLDYRNVSDEIIKKFNIGFCYQGDYANRIIIPSYDVNKKINYFIARSYESKPKLKYKNPEAEKEIIIWNEHLINWDEPIYIVEGPFDCLFLPNSIPMLGKVMGDKLFSVLYEKAKKIIIVLDGDAWENAVKLYHKLNGGRLWGKIWISKLPVDKDIADLQGNLNNYEPIQIE